MVERFIAPVLKTDLVLWQKSFFLGRLRTEANENARENVVERYRFQHQPILLLPVTKYVGKLKPKASLPSCIFTDADEAQM